MAGFPLADPRILTQVAAPPATPAAPTASAQQLAAIDLALADPLNQDLIKAYAPNPVNAASDIARDQVALYGAERFGKMQQLAQATAAVRNQYVAALDTAQQNAPTDPNAACPPGWHWETDQPGRDADVRHTAVFDVDAFTNWYAKQDSLASRAFASLYGGSQTAVEAHGGEQVVRSTSVGNEMFHISNGYWSQIGEHGEKSGWVGSSIGYRGQVAVIDVQGHPDLYDTKSVWFDPAMGFVTLSSNIKAKQNFLDKALPTLAAIGFTAASGVFGGVSAFAGGGLTGAMAGAAAAGALTTLNSSLLTTGSVHLKDILRSALTSAVTAGVTNGLGLNQFGMQGNTVVSYVDRAIAITGQATLQGALQQLAGGKFKDGFTAGIAAGLAAEVTRSMQASIDATVSGGQMGTAEASAYRLLTQATGSAIRMLANPGNPGCAMAQDFLNNLVQEGAASLAAPPMTQDDLRRSEITQGNALAAPDSPPAPAPAPVVEAAPAPAAPEVTPAPAAPPAPVPAPAEAVAPAPPPVSDPTPVEVVRPPTPQPISTPTPAPAPAADGRTDDAPSAPTLTPLVDLGAGLMPTIASVSPDSPAEAKGTETKPDRPSDRQRAAQPGETDPDRFRAQNLSRMSNQLEQELERQENYRDPSVFTVEIKGTGSTVDEWNAQKVAAASERGDDLRPTTANATRLDLLRDGAPLRQEPGNDDAANAVLGDANPAAYRLEPGSDRAKFVGGAVTGLGKALVELPLEVTDVVTAGWNVATGDDLKVGYSMLGERAARGAGTRELALEVGKNAVSVFPLVGASRSAYNLTEALMNGDPEAAGAAAVGLGGSFIAGKALGYEGKVLGWERGPTITNEAGVRFGLVDGPPIPSAGPRYSQGGAVSLPSWGVLEDPVSLNGTAVAEGSGGVAASAEGNAGVAAPASSSTGAERSTPPSPPRAVAAIEAPDEVIGADTQKVANGGPEEPPTAEQQPARRSSPDDAKTESTEAPNSSQETQRTQSSTTAPSVKEIDLEPVLESLVARGGGIRTAGVGVSDVPGLEGQTFEAGSTAVRRNLGVEPTPGPINAPYDYSKPQYAAFIRHAEEEFGNQFIKALDNAGYVPNESGVYTGPSGTARFYMNASEYGVCNQCMLGVRSPAANGAQGVVQQLSEMVPNVEFTFETAGSPNKTVVVKNGQLVENQGK